MASTNRVGMPQALRIWSIFLLLIESKDFLNVITAGKFLALMASIILLSVRICAVVDLPGLNPFWFVRSIGSRIGWMRFNRELKQRRRQRHRKRQKSNRFRLAKQQLCTCVTHFCTFLFRHCTTYNVKMPNFTICRGREYKTKTFIFFSRTLILSFRS